MICLSGHGSKYNGQQTKDNGLTSSGFTLIELLVVMVIVGLSLSLVAPRLISVYEGLKGAAEEQKIVDIVERVRMKSFLRQITYTVVTSNNVLKIQDADLSIEFHHISFPAQTITFNGNGFPDVRQMKYTIKEQEKVLSLDPRKSESL